MNTNINNYSVKVVDSSRELTARERLRLKDTGNAVKLDEACDGAPFTISPVGYAILAIHNDKSDNPDYNNYVVEDSSGNKYVTGSESFWKSFKDIWDEMQDSGEPFDIEIYKLDSNNYKGKQFITCSIL